MQKVIYISLIVVFSYVFYSLGYKNGLPETYELELSLDEILDVENSDSSRWMIDDPIRYRIGKYFLMFPNNEFEKNGSIAVFYEGGSPFFMAQDINSNGVPDELSMTDAAKKSLSATIENQQLRIFDTSFSTVSGTPNLDAVTYIDENFDGQPDVIYSDKEGVTQLP